MRYVILLAMLLVATVGLAAEKAQNFWDPNYAVSETTARAIEEASDQIRCSGRFTRDEQREEVLHLFEEGRKVYARLLA